MKTRVAIAVFLTLLPLITLAQTTTAQQLLQALLPPNAVVPTAGSFTVANFTNWAAAAIAYKAQ